MAWPRLVLVLFLTSLALGAGTEPTEATGPRLRIGCSSVAGFLVEQQAMGTRSVALPVIEVVTVESSDRAWQVAIGSSQQGGIVPLRHANARAAAAAVGLECGRLTQLDVWPRDKPRPSTGRRHEWGALLRHPKASARPELLRWVRHMLGTDDHVRADTLSQRGTAQGGFAVVLDDAGAGADFRGCALRGPNLVLVPSDAQPGAVLPGNLTRPFPRVDLGRECNGAWRREEAVIVAQGGGSVDALLQTNATSGAQAASTAPGAAEGGSAPSGGTPAPAPDDAWAPVSLVELRANARARFLPLLDLIFKGVMHEGMNKVGTPIVTEASAVVAGETGSETSNEALPDQVDGDLGKMLAVRLKSEVTNVASDALTRRLASTLSAALTRTVGSHLLATLPTDDDGGADVIVGEAAARVERSLPLAASSEVTPRLYNALFPALLKSVALATAHAAVPALAAGLQPLRGRPAPPPQDGTSERRMHCDACLRAYLDAQHKYGSGEVKEEAEVTPETLRHCRLCFSPSGIETDKFAYHGMYLTHWYGEYYAEYWRQAAEEYLKKRAPLTEGPLTAERHAKLFTAMRGAELEDK